MGLLILSKLAVNLTSGKSFRKLCMKFINEQDFSICIDFVFKFYLGEIFTISEKFLEFE